MSAIDSGYTKSEMDEAKDRIAVCLRLRPMNSSERRRGCHESWRPHSDAPLQAVEHVAGDGSSVKGEKSYAFGESCAMAACGCVQNG